MKIYKQESNISCGVACLRTIFSHYGKEFTEKEILDKVEFYPLSENRVTNPLIGLAITAMKFGFKSKIIGYSPLLVNNKEGEDFGMPLLKKKTETYFAHGKFVVQKTIEFLENGGDYTVEKLDVEKLKNILDQYEFFIAEISPGFLSKDSSVSCIHKIIVEGYNETGFKILEPSAGIAMSLDFTTFLMAFYATPPEILIITK